MVAGRLTDGENLDPRCLVRVVGVASGDGEALDHCGQRVAPGPIPRVVHVEVPVLRVVGVEGESEEPALEEGVDVDDNVEKGRAQQAHARLVDEDRSVPLYDKEAIRAVRGVSDGQGGGDRDSEVHELQVARGLSRHRKRKRGQE